MFIHSVAVARVHHARASGKRLVERMLGGRHGRIPAVITPALGDHPGVFRQILRELDGSLHKFGLAFTHVHEQVRGCAKRGMKEVQSGRRESQGK